MSIVTRVFLLVAVLVCVTTSQYVTNSPDGSGHSISSASAKAAARANSGNTYSYITPEGQLVKVKYSTSALTKTTSTTNTQKLVVPQITYQSPYLPQQYYQYFIQQPQYPVQSNIQPQYSLVQPQIPYQIQMQPQPLSVEIPEIITPSIQPGAPPAERLFAPAIPGTYPIESDKQLQAYNDYVRQLQQENAGIIGAETSTPNLFSEIEQLGNFKFQ